ncbi:HIG1 domain-containing protein [Aphelenchoides bicaudatus]|nr:HIG1 domain-containing protein [Aphelenchoides bicaudatus]
MLRASILAAIGVRYASASEVVHDRHQAQRYSGVPMITDMSNFVVNKDEKKKKGKLATIMEHNPFVILGCGLTTAALIGMMFKSFKGDKLGAQKMMQYRIMAQFFTVTVLVAGVTLFATYQPTRSNGEAD